MRLLRKRGAFTAAFMLLALGAASLPTPALAQTPACQVTYTKSWEGGNGFGANLVITNNGPAITNGRCRDTGSRPSSRSCCRTPIRRSRGGRGHAIDTPPVGRVPFATRLS
jgi:hypothetical protein